MRLYHVLGAGIITCMRRFHRFQECVSRKSFLAGVVALGVHLTAATAWAQRPASVPAEGGGYLPWLIAAGIAVLVCVCAFLNPKRSHLT
jgi:hypothetical protein